MNGMSVAIRVSAAALAMCAATSFAQPRTTENASLALNQGWEFRQVVAGAQEDGGDWLPATVPGTFTLTCSQTDKSPIRSIAKMKPSRSGSRTRVGNTG